MLRRMLWLLSILLVASSLFTATGASAQDIDLSGDWRVFQVSPLSRFSLKEYNSPSPLVTADDMTLNADGTVAADLAYLTISKWAMDEGFVVFETAVGNAFFWPRSLSDNSYLFVRVDVVERNEDIISITSRPLGNLILVRK